MPGARWAVLAPVDEPDATAVPCDAFDGRGWSCASRGEARWTVVWPVARWTEVTPAVDELGKARSTLVTPVDESDATAVPCDAFDGRGWSCVFEGDGWIGLPLVMPVAGWTEVTPVDEPDETAVLCDNPDGRDWSGC